MMKLVFYEEDLEPGQAIEMSYEFEAFLDSNKIYYQSDLHWNRDRLGNESDYVYTTIIATRTLRKKNNLNLIEDYIKLHNLDDYVDVDTL